MQKASAVIEHFRLSPLPEEGGYFRRFFTHDASVPESERKLSSAIYYLITQDTFSKRHRLLSAVEIFNHLDGSPAQMQIGDEERILGKDFARGHQPTAIVPAGVWQSLRIDPSASDPEAWALFCVTVTPEYLDADFELWRA